MSGILHKKSRTSQTTRQVQTNLLTVIGHVWSTQGVGVTGGWRGVSVAEDVTDDEDVYAPE